MTTTPDYIRIANAIVEDARSGKLAPGAKLPSIAQLSRTHGVHASTIKMTYVRLEALQVIERSQGRGVFVTDPKTWMRQP